MSGISVADPAILGRPILLIGRQLLTRHSKVIDLLGMDAEGCLHVLELKRNRTPRDVVAQLLDYGTWVQDLSNEQALPIGARVFTHIPKAGYVGVGTVAGEAQPFENAALAVDGEVVPMSRLPLKGAYGHDSAAPADEAGADRREWVVPVDWEKAVPRDQALWRAGFFANQKSACKLRAHFTIDEVSRHFDIA